MNLTNQQFAQALFEQHAARARFSSLRPADGVLDTAAAYDVQDELVALLRKARNADIVGYKIGLTSTAMQTMCGIDKPVFGRILSDQVFQSEHESISGNTSILAWNSKSRSSSAAISSPTAALVHGRYRGMHGGSLPPLELVDDRHADYSALDACSLIADNAWNAGVVLADWQPLPNEFSVRQGRVFSQDRRRKPAPCVVIKSFRTGR